MKKLLLINYLVLAIIFNACAQNARTKGDVGGPCEVCEAIYECPKQFDQLTDTVYLPDWNEDSTGIAISGTIYKADGKTPAAYPDRTGPAHIHITIKEPGRNEYRIDEFLFDDDPI